MDLDGLINIITTIKFQDFEKKQEEIQKELHKLGIKPNDHLDLLNKISKITNITENPKIRESYLRSYFRIYQEVINKDGRGSSIIIEITKRCTKNCKHCYSKSTNQTQDMPDNVLEFIIEFARKHYKHIFITGGEPTQDPRIFSLAENNPDILFFVFTNGSTITDTFAKRLSSYGNLILLLGIDGGSKSTHDYFRGKGSYDEVMKAIELLNKNKVSWGFISLVTEINAKEVLSQDFIENKKKKGAFIMRYLEYLPVGLNPQKDLILSGDTYYFLEQRKKEIIKSGRIYLQETVQKKCNGLLYFDVDGNIKNCFCFHYAKYNVLKGNINESIQKTLQNWISYNWKGECPLYSDPVGFKNHLEKLGWKKISTINEPYLTNPKIARHMIRNYKQFLKIKAQQG